MKRLSLIFIGLMATFGVRGQYPSDSSARLFAKVAVTQKGVLLRWMPTDYAFWRLANIHGYTIERELFIADSQLVKRQIVVFPSIRPQEAAGWQKMRQTPTVKLCQALLFSDHRNDTIPDLSFQTGQAQDHDIQLLGISLAADANASVATKLGLRFDDLTARQNETYMYRIYVNGHKGDTLKLLVDAGRISEAKIADAPSVAYQKGNVAVLRWLHSDNSDYTTYNVERSDDGGRTFLKVNTLPLLPTYSESPKDTSKTIFSDSLRFLNKTYFYRLRGINMFAQASPVVNPLKVYAYETRLPEPSQFKATIEDNKRVALSWEYPAQWQGSFKGFKVWRSAVADTLYKPLTISFLSTTDRSFTDNYPMGENHYRVVAINDNNEPIESLDIFVQLVDATPPYTPQRPIGRVFSSGLVDLEWKTDSLEKVSYRVYRGERRDTEFSLVSGSDFAGTCFTDTLSLKLGNKKVFYFIQSLDNRYNPSLPSDTTLVMRPDLFPPSPPSFYNFVLADTAVVVSWHNSPSPDLSHTLLLRQASTDSAACVLLSFKVFEPNVTYIDRDVSNPTTYTYSLVAVDEGNLATKPEECQIKLSPLAITVRAAMPFNMEADTSQKAVHLHWDYPSAKQVATYIIYRQKLPEQYLSKFKYLGPSISTFTDKTIEAGVHYKYAIRAVWKDQSETKLSVLKEVVIEKE